VSDAALADLAEIMLSNSAGDARGGGDARIPMGAAQLLESTNLQFVCGLDSWTKRERRIAAVRSLPAPAWTSSRWWKEVLGNVEGFDTWQCAARGDRSAHDGICRCGQLRSQLVRRRARSRFHAALWVCRC